jgi:hypothetical protein
MFSCQKKSSRTARGMRFCLLLMWGVTLSSSTLLRRQLTPIESNADEIQQNTHSTTRQLQDAVNGTGGSSPPPEVTGTNPAEVTGTIPAAPAPPPTGNETIPGNGNPNPGTVDSGKTPANIAPAPDNSTPKTNPFADADIDFCKTATAVDSCEGCKAAASSVTENDKTCWWENGTCTKKSTERDQGEMCVVQTARPTVSPTFSPSPRPTSSPSKARVDIPQQNYPDEEEGFDFTKVLAFVFFGAIIALAVRKRDFIRNLISGDAGTRSSKRSGRYQEM